MQKYLAYFASLVVVLVADASPITVTGKVVDSHGRPIADALITVSHRPVEKSDDLKVLLDQAPMDTTMTNAKGEFAIKTDTNLHFLEVYSKKLQKRRVLSHFATSGNVIRL